MRELSLNVLDIAQNSISAGAKLIEIDIREDTAKRLLTIRIADDGCGMTREKLKSVTDPFYTTRTTRKVGMGVPLFRMAAEMTGGSFEIDSEPGKGTVVTALFHTDHVDFVPLGDICSTVTMLICMNTDRDFRYCRQRIRKISRWIRASFAKCWMACRSTRPRCANGSRAISPNRPK